MLSVVIATHDSERALLPTLAALVPGAVAGIVREVIVADAGSGDATAQIADGAGCRVLISSGTRGARLNAAAESARAPWLLFLPPGSVPDATWIDETRRFVEEAALRGCADSYAAAFRRVSATFRPTLIDALALLGSALGARPHTSQGLLIAKALYGRLGGHVRDGDTPERDLVRRLGRRRIVLLRAGAIDQTHNT
jgi:glycosyltransferase involved in cell wall biosynthesis